MNQRRKIKHKQLKRYRITKTWRKFIKRQKLRMDKYLTRSDIHIADLKRGTHREHTAYMPFSL